LRVRNKTLTDVGTLGGNLCGPPASNGYGPITGSLKYDGTFPADYPQTIIGSVVDDSLVNTTGEQVRISYQVATYIIGTNQCQGPPRWVDVIINPQPVGADDTDTTCSDVALDYNLQANLDSAQAANNAILIGGGANIGAMNTVPSLFTYTVSSSDQANVPAAAHRTTGSAANITDTYNNVTSNDVYITYQIVPASDPQGCVGDTFDVVVTIHPEPAASDSSMWSRSNSVIGLDLQTHVDSNGNGVMADFEWVAAPVAGIIGESITPQMGDVLTDQLVNITQQVQSVVYTVTPTSVPYGCVGDPFTINVSFG
jgi:hypothetical protein